MSRQISTAQRTNRIAPLDGWRGVSIGFVILGHAGLNVGTWRPGIFASLAGLGVFIFFVISGFIITKTSLRELRDTGSFSVRAFYTRRAFRIAPPFFTFLLAIVVLRGLSVIEQPLSGVAKAGAFLCNVGLPDLPCGLFVAHSWSLAVEEQFYLAFAILFGLAGRGIAKIAGLVLVVVLALPFFRFVPGIGPWVHALLGFTLPFSFICAGCLAAVYEEQIARVCRSSYARWLSVVAFAAIAALMIADGILMFPLASAGSYLLAMLNRLALPICVTWLVVSSIERRTLFTAVLSAPALLFVGSISYSLYLWQQVFLAPWPLYTGFNLFFVSPMMVVMAWLSYRFIELPGIALGRRLSARHIACPDSSLRSGRAVASVGPVQ